MEIMIRPAREADYGILATLSGQLGYEADPATISRRMKEITANPDHAVFVASVAEGEVVGWIHAFYTLRVESDPFVEIGGMVVDDRHRKKGIGKQLVDHIREWATARGCRRLRVRSNVTRQETHRFYQNLGFELKKEQGVFDWGG